MSEEEHAQAKAIDGIVYMIMVGIYMVYHFIGL
jgi:hypothetical protein